MRYVLFCLILFVISYAGILAIFDLVKEIDTRSEHAKSIGCEYIGRARDLNSVAFYDCNGIVKMERVK